MVRRAIYFVVITALVAVIAGSACAKVASRYEVQRISLSGDISGSITSITNSGIVSGFGYNVAGTPGLVRHNLNTGVTEFTDQISTFEDINNSGTVVGLYNTRNGVKQYCVWNPDGTITDLPLVPSYTVDFARINDAGAVLGAYGNLVWTAQSGSNHPTVPMTDGSWSVLDFNNSGSYLGRSWNSELPGIVLPPIIRPASPPSSEGVSDASGFGGGLILIGTQYTNAIWGEDGSYQEIDKSSANWMRLNDLNQAAGTEFIDDNTHVVFWDAEKGKTDLTAGMTGRFNCSGLNNAGQVLIGGPTNFIYTGLGGYILIGSSSNYIWDAESGMRSVQDLLDPASGWHISSCSAINDQGWITAYGWRQGNLGDGGSYYSGNIVLRPVATPEPSSVVAMLVGFVGLAGVVRRRKG